jgi:hypothetical protein
MRDVTFEPARPLDTDRMPWIPTGPGKSFRPLRFAADPEHRKDTIHERRRPFDARHARIELRSGQPDQ